ncbi:MAG: DMT family transporter [Oscillospiraceae bacterium]|nr:DMT family transporter [Oscillospiraceae bacterium]
MAKKMRILGPIMLVSAAMIWGLSFVAQKQGMEYVEGFTFNGIRSLLGAIVLIPFILIRAVKNPMKLSPAEKKQSRKDNFKGIMIVGLMLCIGSNLQQFAFNYIEPGRVGFITALYMLIVPLISFIVYKKKQPVTTWIGVILGVVGLYMICMGGSASFSLGKGDILALLCSFAFALHIIVIDKFAAKIDCVVLSCGQFFVTGVISCILMFVFESPNIQSIMQAAVPILYAGIMSCGCAFTFQVIGQKYTEPTISSMLLCLESVFSVIFSFIILGERMASVEYIGCAVMFVAIIIAQLPAKKSVK